MKSATELALPNSKDTILDAAEILMARVGYGKASISQICQESGLPVGSIYHHFGSKAGLLSAIMERASARFYATMPQPSDDPTVSNEQRVREYWLSAADTIYANLTYFTLEADLARSKKIDEDLAQIVSRDRKTTHERLEAVLLPYLRELGIDNPENFAHRQVLFTVAFTRGAVIDAGDDLPRLRALMTDLYSHLHAVIREAAATKTSV